MKYLLLSVSIIFLFACNNTSDQIAEVVKTDTLTFPAPSPTTIKQGKATTDNVKTSHPAAKNLKKTVKIFGATVNNITVGTGSGSVFLDGTAKIYDTIKVQAGTYSGGVTFANVNGLPNKATVIINVGGQVIGSGGSDAGLDLSTCRYVHFTGTGTSGVQYGFKGSGGGTASFDAHYGTSDAEIDHIECSGSLYAGLVFRTYPSTGCQWSVTGNNGPATQAQMNTPIWAIYNMLIHDNYVHDVPGEGMYLGQSHYGNADANAYTPAGGNPLGGCSSGNESPVIGAKVYNNIVKNVGYDGIQMSGCISGCSVNYNTIIGFATGNADGQDGGITWNPGSVGSVDHNWIEYTGSGVCMGIMYQGQGDTYITNNVIKGGGKGQVGLALLRNTQPNVIGSTHAKIFIANNTVTGFLTGYWWYGDNGFGSNVFFSNNIINAPTVYSIGNGAITAVQKTTNIETSSFVFTSATDFHLPANSPAIGKGTPLSYVTDDYDKKLRPNPPSIGAYEGGSGGVITPPADTLKIAVSPDQSIILGTGVTTTTVTLTSSATSTTGSAITSYLWQGNSGTITTPASNNTTVSGLTAGNYSFSITAKDAAGTSATAITKVNIAAASTGGGTQSVTVAPGSVTTVPITTGNSAIKITVTSCPTCPPPTVQRTALKAYIIGNAIWCKYTVGNDSTFLGNATTIIK